MTSPFETPDNQPWISVSSKLIALRILRIYPLIIIPCVVAIIISIAVKNTVLGVIFFLLLILCCSVGYYFIYFNYKSWGYVERADDLWIKHGRFFRKLSVVPYGRMQLIDITAGPIERYLKINKIKMHTAAATTDAEIVAIDSTIAATLKDSLSSKTKAHLQGI
jgi:hypothetical protein